MTNRNRNCERCGRFLDKRGRCKNEAKHRAQNKNMFTASNSPRIFKSSRFGRNEKPHLSSFDQAIQVMEKKQGKNVLCKKCYATMAPGEMYCLNCGDDRKSLCPHCKTKLSHTDNYCLSCGETVNNYITTSPFSEMTQTPTTYAYKVLKICGTCKTKLEDGNQTCLTCGNKPNPLCANCHSAIPTDATSCLQCGY